MERKESEGKEKEQGGCITDPCQAARSAVPGSSERKPMRELDGILLDYIDVGAQRKKDDI